MTADTPRSTYNGKTYYFCCAGCKVMFDKNPQEYVK
ncbi:MAG: YHS domain-containing protein [Deltaproteobacteria bacterium]|nr:YHS domain-containing protein [Deltaproteobacteria bacterium]